jgi:hypothetical protein
MEGQAPFCALSVAKEDIRQKPDAFCSNWEAKMNDLMLVLGWGSPIGTGLFLVCLAGMIYILSRVNKKQA